MDWTIAGVMVAVAALTVAVLQYRHSRRPTPQVQVTQSAPTLHYKIVDGEGSYPLSAELKFESLDPNWVRFESIKDELSRFRFAFLTITNPKAHRIERVSLRWTVYRLWDARVACASSLAEGAIRLSAVGNVLAIEIDELPSKERVQISVVAGGGVLSTVKSANAAVQLKELWD